MRKKNCSKWIAKFIILHHSTILQAAKFIFLIFTILHWNLYAPWHLVGSWLCSGQQNCCSSQEGMRVIWYHLEPRRGEEYCSEECCLWDCWFIRLWGQVLGSMVSNCLWIVHLSHTLCYYSWSSYFIAVPSKLFLSQPTIFTLCVSNSPLQPCCKKAGRSERRRHKVFSI